MKTRGRIAQTYPARKKKGRRAVLAVRDLLLAATGLSDKDVFITTTSVGGVDIHLSEAAAKQFPFAIEVKAQEALNIWAALAQATANAEREHLPPIVFFTRNHSPIFVALRATDLLTFISAVRRPDVSLDKNAETIWPRGLPCQTGRN